jgi:hypothetical protein
MQQVFGNGNYYWDGDTHNTPGFHYHTWAELAGGSHHPDDGTEHHHPGGDAAHHHHDEHVHRDRSSASRFIVPIEIAPTEDEDVVVRGESRRAGISPTCAQATFLDVRTFPRAVEAEDYTTTVPTNDERSVVDALFDSDWADVLPSLV